MYDAIYKSLQQGFQQSWFKLLFWFTDLAKIIIKKEEPSAWVFFNTYLSSWWWTRLWIRYFIQDKYHRDMFDEIIQTFQILKNSDLFNEENCNAVASYQEPGRLPVMLNKFQKAKHLTQDNFDLIISNQKKHQDMASILLFCYEKKIVVTQNIRANLAKFNDPMRFASTLHILQKTELLTEDNLAMIANHANPVNFDQALSHLQQAGILTQDNFKVLAIHVNPPDVATTLYYLNQAQILTEDNRAIVANHAYPRLVAYALSHLQQAGILTQNNFELVAKHAYPRLVAYALSDLHDSWILTAVNRAIVANHANPVNFTQALSHLHIAHILTQDNFDLVANHPKPRHLALTLSRLTQNHINFIAKATAIILEKNDDYLTSKNLAPTSIQNMLIPKAYHFDREKYLNRIIAFFLNKTLKSLPLDVIAYILEFIEDVPFYRSEAWNVIQHVQLPKNLDPKTYASALKDKTQEYTQFDAELSHLKIPKHKLLFNLHNFSFWVHRHSCPEAQHVFDKQYGLVIRT